MAWEYLGFSGYLLIILYHFINIIINYENKKSVLIHLVLFFGYLFLFISKCQEIKDHNEKHSKEHGKTHDSKEHSKEHGKTHDSKEHDSKEHGKTHDSKEHGKNHGKEHDSKAFSIGDFILFLYFIIVFISPETFNEVRKLSILSLLGHLILIKSNNILGHILLSLYYISEIPEITNDMTIYYYIHISSIALLSLYHGSYMKI